MAVGGADDPGFLGWSSEISRGTKITVVLSCRRNKFFGRAK
jgi:hypothetical protein